MGVDGGCDCGCDCGCGGSVLRFLSRTHNSYDDNVGGYRRFGSRIEGAWELLAQVLRTLAKVCVLILLVGGVLVQV